MHTRKLLLFCLCLWFLPVFAQKADTLNRIVYTPDLPDRDKDGIPDNVDACPDVKGILPSGCPDTLIPGKMIFIPGGTFEMGDLFGDGFPDEQPVHTVAVGDFYLGQTEVTFDEFDAYCDATGQERRYDEWWGRGRRPVIYVSWFDAVRYCNWLSQQQGFTNVYTINGETVSANWLANGYRLPTEAEWEYAARSGGKQERYSGISDESELYRYGNFRDQRQDPHVRQNDGYKYTAPVGSYLPNGLQLYDMAGNVSEWCWDWYSRQYYSKSEPNDPKGPAGGIRVVRGGSWKFGPAHQRATYRNDASSAYFGDSLGFRLCRSARAGE